MFGKCINEIKKLKETQAFLKADLNNEYTVGQYNGIEYALSVLEQREPEYAVIIKEPEVKEVQKEIGRTVASGIKRRGNG